MKNYEIMNSEHVVRGYLRQTGSTVVGLDKRITDRPTSYAMSCMFSSLQVVECEGVRQFARPLTTPQKEYLEALDLTEEQLLMYDGGGNDSGYG